ncbi:PLP-dependent aminotransferase family protein [Rugosimonospora acidiphila]|uniref:PLP-dependent aminotransferase family protein n=2 Tax=Rugosimonospora acidiphila TaxID=556531 RepID=A0ABP9RMC0_9ACTN
MFPVSLDRQLTRPLWQQLAEQVCSAVDAGVLAAGTRMPSTRTLAALLGVSRGVPMEAYELLFQSGYAASRPGSGTYVTVPARLPGDAGARCDAVGARSGASGAPCAVLGARHGGGRAGGDGGVDLLPGQVGGASLPMAAWRAAWRWASFRPPPTGAPPPLGLPELRQAVAGFVRRTHGVSLAGREVVATTGTAAGLRAVLAVLGLSGGDVAVEEPIAPPLWRAAEGGGSRPVAVPVHGEGARVERVPDRCRALVLCPDSGVPSGAVLSAERRRVAASRPGTWIVEVACDGLLPPAAQRLPRLLSLAAPETSVLVGGFGEALSPALGIGFVVVPRWLTGALGRHLAERSGQPPHVSQLAMARLLHDGTVDRAMHRRGRDHQDGGHLVRSALGRVGYRVAGAHGVALLPLPGRHAELVAARLRARGVRVGTLAPYHFSPAPIPPALVVGHGHLTGAALEQAVARLVAALPGALSTD